MMQARHQRLNTAEHRDHLKSMRKKTDHSSPYVTFQMRQKHHALRKSLPLRQVAHGDRIRMQEFIRNSALQNALKSEKALIEGYQTRMNLPPHLQQRLSELHASLQGA